MRTTSMFESDSFSHVSSASSGGVTRDMEDENSRQRSPDSDDHHRDFDWGIVSVSSDSGEVGVLHEETTTAADNEFFEGHQGENTGILIVDGAESTLGDPSAVGSGSWDLSIPRTDSFPTEIGTLDDHRSQFDGSEEEYSLIRPYSWSRRNMSYVMLLVGLAVFSTTSGLLLLTRERNEWRLSAQQLEQEVERLAQEAEKMKLDLDMKTSLETKDASPNSVTLLDNCWVQAKADVKLGICGQETRDSFRETLGAIWKAASAGGDSGSPTDDSESSHHESSESSKTEYSSEAVPLPLAVGEAFAAASGRIASKITEILGDDQDGGDYDSLMDDAAAGLSEASVALGEAMAAASEAISFELKELTGDPWTYIADSAREAMQDASYTAKPGKVNTKIFTDAASTVSSSSLAWGEAMANAGEAVSSKLVKAFEDPLSFAGRRSRKD